LPCSVRKGEDITKLLADAAASAPAAETPKAGAKAEVKEEKDLEQEKEDNWG
jgi:ribosomal protein L12E/L44/L45/RPP1/RPP2